MAELGLPSSLSLHSWPSNLAVFHIVLLCRSPSVTHGRMKTYQGLPVIAHLCLILSLYRTREGHNHIIYIEPFIFHWYCVKLQMFFFLEALTFLGSVINYSISKFSQFSEIQGFPLHILLLDSRVSTCFIWKQWFCVWIFTMPPNSFSFLICKMEKIVVFT